MRARVAATGSGAEWQEAVGCEHGITNRLRGMVLARSYAADCAHKSVPNRRSHINIEPRPVCRARSPSPLPPAPSTPLAGASAAAELLTVRLEM